MLIADSATFIETIGQMPSRQLNTVSTTQASRFNARNLSTRACMTEKTSSAEPAQPRMSNQLTGRGYRGRGYPSLVATTASDAASCSATLRSVPSSRGRANGAHRTPMTYGTRKP